MKTLIGKKYVALDNSYSLNLTNPEREHWLAGTANQNPKEALILSEPYLQEVENVVGNIKEYEFINVKYNNDTIRVMYYEKSVEADLQERIKRNNNRWFFI